MKLLQSVIATNSVITLADGTREVIADEALEDRARQINEGAGLPHFIEHDRLRICGWSHRGWTERDKNLFKLVIETEIPETEDERQSLLRKYAAYRSEEASRRIAPYEGLAKEFDTPNIVLTYDKEYVLLRAPKLARNYCPSVFDTMDDDGLVPLTKEMLSENGGLKCGNFLLVPSRYLRASFSLPNQINRELMNRLLWHVGKNGHEVMLALEEDLLAIPNSYEPIAAREYWWGPKYNGDPSKQARGMSVHAPTTSDIFNGLIRTEFWWYGKTETTFEVEEIADQSVPLTSGEHERGMRFVHSIFDASSNKSRHLDGAIRMYSTAQWTESVESKITDFGKKAKRIKLWRIDGLLDHENWYDLIHAFFRGNYTVGEYFGFPDPRTHRAQVEASLRN